MVRGPAALLIAAAAGAALLVAAPLLPAPGGLPVSPPGDAQALVAGGVGLLAVVGTTLVVAPAIEARWVLWVALPSAAVLLGAMNAAGLAGAATPAEALAYALAGVTFAAVLETPALALALPVFVAAVDLASVLGGGPGVLQIEPHVSAGDPLSLELPAWGATFAAGRLNPACVVFMAAYAAYAHRFGMRAAAAGVGMALALVGALAWIVGSGSAAPALALVSAGFLLPNIGRIPALARMTKDS